MTAAAPFPDSPAFEVASPDGTAIAVFAASRTSDAAPGVADRPGRAPLLLVHGATADHTTFRVAAPLLARTRPVFAVDRRGRGASGDAGEYAIEREFEDVAAVANELARRSGDGIVARVGAVDVAGHSYGGRCALGASLLTTSIRRVVAYEGAPVPPGISYRPPGMVDAVRAALERGDGESALETFLRGIVGMSDAELARYRADPVWPARVAAAHTILREVEAETSAAASLEALRRVRVPVLLILGSISRSPFRVGTDALAALLPRAEVAVIDGAAHAAHHTHPAEFVRLVESFLDREASQGE